jgi:hypothetical protein
MLRLVLSALVVAGLVPPASGAGWIERYFGVGSAGAPAVACSEAREDAQGNSARACSERKGSRVEERYTECVCQRLSDELHICNVNLKVSCGGPLSSASGRGTRDQGGKPKGRADRRSATTGAWRVRTDQPGPKVRIALLRTKGPFGMVAPAVWR